MGRALGVVCTPTEAQSRSKKSDPRSSPQSAIRPVPVVPLATTSNAPRSPCNFTKHNEAGEPEHKFTDPTTLMDITLSAPPSEKGGAHEAPISRENVGSPRGRGGLHNHNDDGSGTNDPRLSLAAERVLGDFAESRNHEVAGARDQANVARPPVSLRGAADHEAPTRMQVVAPPPGAASSGAGSGVKVLIKPGSENDFGPGHALALSRTTRVDSFAESSSTGGAVAMLAVRKRAGSGSHGAVGALGYVFLGGDRKRKREEWG